MCACGLLAYQPNAHQCHRHRSHHKHCPELHLLSFPTLAMGAVEARATITYYRVTTRYERKYCR